VERNLALNDWSTPEKILPELVRSLSDIKTYLGNGTFWKYNAFRAWSELAFLILLLQSFHELLELDSPQALMSTTHFQTIMKCNGFSTQPTEEEL
jgi:hypothetical protein